MNILFVTIAWPIHGERNLYSDLMDEFVNNGHKIYVIFADENVSGNSVNVEKGINVLRVSTKKVRKVNFLQKALSLITLGVKLKKAYLEKWSKISIDLIISPSPPITLSGFLKFLKRRLHVPLYYLLKDIWPHSFVDLGVVSKNSIIYFFFRFHEKRIYKIADFIGCMSQMNKDYILRKNKFLSMDKVEVCPNSITPRNLILNGKRNEVRIRHKVPEHATVFVFSGNICKGHGLDFFLEAIEGLKDFQLAYFLIGGSGHYYNYAVSEIKRRRLNNVGFYPRLPSDEFDQLLLASDVGVILLDSKYKLPEFPSRLLAYLEAKKPVLCSVNRETDIGSIIENARCGLSTIHGDKDGFTKAIKYFCDPANSTKIQEMGNNAFTLLLGQYTSAISYQTIIQHFGD